MARLLGLISALTSSALYPTILVYCLISRRISREVSRWIKVAAWIRVKHAVAAKYVHLIWMWAQGPRSVTVRPDCQSFHAAGEPQCHVSHPVHSILPIELSRAREKGTVIPSFLISLVIRKDSRLYCAPDQPRLSRTIGHQADIKIHPPRSIIR